MYIYTVSLSYHRHQTPSNNMYNFSSNQEVGREVGGFLTYIQKHLCFFFFFFFF